MMVDIKDERDRLKAVENLFREKRFSDALAGAKKLKDDFPNSFQVRFLYVRVLKELNSLDEAEEQLVELMQIFPNNINLLLEIGKLSADREKFSEALEYYNKILFLDPFNTEAKESIEKIRIMKKKKGKEADGISGNAFFSYTDGKVDSADTQMEFDPELMNQFKFGEEQAPPLELTPDEQMDEAPPDLDLPPPVLDFEFKMDEPAAEEPGEMPGTAPPKPQPPPPPSIPEGEDEEEEPEQESNVSGSMFDFKEEEPAKAPEEKIPEIEIQDVDTYSDSDFVTESAADLYLKQGLLNDALDIYEKLYNVSGEERFLEKIERLRIHLKKQEINRAKIQALEGYLKMIKQRTKGEQIV
jgi:tetratricopeptide (TPR) repeat protein